MGAGAGLIGPLTGLLGNAIGGNNSSSNSAPAISPQMVLNEQENYANQMGRLGVAGGSWVPITEGDIANQAAVQNQQVAQQQQQITNAQNQQNAGNLGDVLGSLNSQGSSNSGTPGLSNTTST